MQNKRILNLQIKTQLIVVNYRNSELFFSSKKITWIRCTVIFLVCLCVSFAFSSAFYFKCHICQIFPFSSYKIFTCLLFCQTLWELQVQIVMGKRKSKIADTNVIFFTLSPFSSSSSSHMNVKHTWLHHWPFNQKRVRHTHTHTQCSNGWWGGVGVVLVKSDLCWRWQGSGILQSSVCVCVCALYNSVIKLPLGSDRGGWASYLTVRCVRCVGWSIPTSLQTISMPSATQCCRVCCAALLLLFFFFFFVVLNQEWANFFTHGATMSSSICQRAQSRE